MTLLTRQALGFFCVAAIAYVIGLAGDGNTAEFAIFMGNLIAVIGLVTLAWAMFRRTDQG